LPRKNKPGDQIRSKQRVADHGEVLTSEREVNAMLDMVAPEAARPESRFLEPACGDGNFMAEILRRKLRAVTDACRGDAKSWEKNAFVSVASIYGIDILPDNAAACRKRLMGIFDEFRAAGCGKKASEKCRLAVRHVLGRNVVCGDALTMTDEAGGPIVFSEWSLVAGDQIRRADFRLEDLVRGAEMKNRPEENWKFDEEARVFLPPPVREFPPVHYLLVGTLEKS
jgi:hypothetical protein